MVWNLRCCKFQCWACLKLAYKFKVFQISAWHLWHGTGELHVMKGCKFQPPMQFWFADYTFWNSALITALSLALTALSLVLTALSLSLTALSLALTALSLVLTALSLAWTALSLALTAFISLVLTTQAYSVKVFTSISQP